jgi:hypothetical protein
MPSYRPAVVYGVLETVIGSNDTRKTIKCPEKPPGGVTHGKKVHAEESIAGVQFLQGLLPIISTFADRVSVVIRC